MASISRCIFLNNRLLSESRERLLRRYHRSLNRLAIDPVFLASRTSWLRCTVRPFRICLTASARLAARRSMSAASFISFSAILSNSGRWVRIEGHKEFDESEWTIFCNPLSVVLSIALGAVSGLTRTGSYNASKKPIRMPSS